jgi:hypothetical protein
MLGVEICSSPLVTMVMLWYTSFEISELPFFFKSLKVGGIVKTVPFVKKCLQMHGDLKSRYTASYFYY